MFELFGKVRKADFENKGPLPMNMSFTAIRALPETPSLVSNTVVLGTDIYILFQSGIFYKYNTLTDTYTKLATRTVDAITTNSSPIYSNGCIYHSGSTSNAVYEISSNTWSVLNLSYLNTSVGLLKINDDDYVIYNNVLAKVKLNKTSMTVLESRTIGMDVGAYISARAICHVNGFLYTPGPVINGYLHEMDLSNLAAGFVQSNRFNLLGYNLIGSVNILPAGDSLIIASNMGTGTLGSWDNRLLLAGRTLEKSKVFTLERYGSQQSLARIGNNIYIFGGTTTAPIGSAGTTASFKYTFS